MGALGCLLAGIAFAAADLPDLAAVRAAHRSSDARLLDRNGEALTELRIDPGLRRLDWVPIAGLSPALRSALIASEDKRFYEHSGVDWQALAGAMWDNLRRGIEGRRPRGASTLTMQLAGMLDESLRLRGSTRTIEQKWDQALAARELERRWSKAEILEAYLNLATFRGELLGIDAASRGLFGKAAHEIDAAEAAILAALLRGPNAAPPVVARRACLVVAQLARGPACAEVTRLTLTALPGPHRIAHADAAPQLARRLLTRSAMAVASTLDAAVQRAAAGALQRHLARAHGGLEGAVVVLDNASGDVLAYVAASPEVPGAADGVLAQRPAAATLLPFLYSLALERRLLTAASVLDDSAQNLAPPPGLPLVWEPEGGYRGAVSVRTALASSLAAPALRTLSLTGTQAFHERLDQLGLERSTQANLLALTNAYRALALGGEATPWRLTQDEPAATRKRVMRRDASFVVSDILAEPVPQTDDPMRRRPPLWCASRSVEAGDGRDAWALGYTERFAVGVRLGSAVAGELRDDEGVAIAEGLWRDIVRLLHTGASARQPRAPAGLASRLTRFEPPIEPPRREWFIAGTELESVTALAEPSAAAARIAFPAMGATILLNPGAGEQRMIFLVRNPAHGLRWRVNTQRLEAEGGQASWTPIPGRHRVVLVNMLGTELDAVDFEVREVQPDSQPAQEESGEQ